MHVHILGICGTFMGGVAALAKAAGHRVTGSDANVYPPMSIQLDALGIKTMEGFEATHLEPAPDCVIVGNVMSRGNPAIEHMLNKGIKYTSGPEWLARFVLHDRWVLAVAGTHGKTTTASILAWILESAGLEPGFLIGGVAGNFCSTARYGNEPFFVVEADEYDCAFFDKRAKFVHYQPRTLILNNLEFDHADIYSSIEEIKIQFHHLIRTVPETGKMIVNANDANLSDVLAMGCWSEVEKFSARKSRGADWHVEDPTAVAPRVLNRDTQVGEISWSMPGIHNLENALAAIAAARHAGVPSKIALAALEEFQGVKRRLELRGQVNGISVYDDFAHHPTAIAATLEGLRLAIGSDRLIAVLEPRSNTMKMGIHRETLGPALASADRVWLFRPPDMSWNLDSVSAILGDKAQICDGIPELVHELNADLETGDHVVVMSNGGFGGLHELLLEKIAGRGDTQL